jgi:hypothetical protein
MQKNFERIQESTALVLQEVGSGGARSTELNKRRRIRRVQQQPSPELRCEVPRWMNPSV